jgi:endo-1,4-beta-xylanase
MPTRIRLIAILVAVTAALIIGLRIYHRRHLRPLGMPPENSGNYTGPLTRPATAYNPKLAPSRPWLDAKRTAPPPTTYHAYAASSINGQQTDYLLYLPAGYNDPASATRRYPVIYWLHGFDAEPQYGLPFVETLDAAIRKGICPPIIAVLPNGLRNSWYANSVDGAQPVEDIIIKDLIPHIDETCRTLPDRTGRAVEGFSMGGWGAAHLAFKYPDQFCAVTMVCALLYTHDWFPQLQPIFSGSESAYYADDPITRAHRNTTELKAKIKLRLLAGGNDTLLHGLAFAKRFDLRLTEWNYPHEFQIVPGVGHNDGDLYQKLGPRVFAFYKSVFTSPNIDAPDLSASQHRR